MAPPPGSPVYVDLAYVPNHCSAKNVDQEFFKRVRAAYYVVSGNDGGGGEPSRRVLDALLDGKAQWGSNLQVGPLSTPQRRFLSRQLFLTAFLSPEGDPDPDPRHGGDPGLVPADPREAAGPQHHGPGVQQHRGHAGRVLPRLQDRVLGCSAPPLPRPILCLAIIQASHGTALQRIRRRAPPLIALAEVSTFPRKLDKCLNFRLQTATKTWMSRRLETFWLVWLGRGAGGCAGQRRQWSASVLALNPPVTRRRAVRGGRVLISALLLA